MDDLPLAERNEPLRLEDEELLRRGVAVVRRFDEPAELLPARFLNEPLLMLPVAMLARLLVVGVLRVLLLPDVPVLFVVLPIVPALALLFWLNELLDDGRRTGVVAVLPELPLRLALNVPPLRLPPKLFPVGRVVLPGRVVTLCEPLLPAYRLPRNSPRSHLSRIPLP